jgi:hypothetical protein
MIHDNHARTAGFFMHLNSFTPNRDREEKNIRQKNDKKDIIKSVVLADRFYGAKNIALDFHEQHPFSICMP